MSVRQPIAWGVAERVAQRVSGFEPFSVSYHATSLESDFTELTRKAEALVEAETGLVANGPARVRVADRHQWVAANLRSFERLLRPFTERLSERMTNSWSTRIGGGVTGVQIGIVLGWMSARVLGQYDLLLLEDERPEDQDLIYYVGPNVLALEKRFAFPPSEFRLWLALHECTHRAQFTGVSWLPEFFRSQVHELLESVNPDPRVFGDALKQAVEQVRSNEDPVADGGLIGALAGPEHKRTVSRIMGLMSLLEGHGEVTMARAGADLVPSAERFHRVLAERRAHASGATKMMQRILGVEAKLRQYAQGEAFIKAVEAEGGADLAGRVWRSADHLPDYDEIRNPNAWIARVREIDGESV